MIAALAAWWRILRPAGRLVAAAAGWIGRRLGTWWWRARRRIADQVDPAARLGAVSRRRWL